MARERARGPLLLCLCSCWPAERGCGAQRMAARRAHGWHHPGRWVKLCSAGSESGGARSRLAILAVTADSGKGVRATIREWSCTGPAYLLSSRYTCSLLAAAPRARMNVTWCVPYLECASSLGANRLRAAQAGAVAARTGSQHSPGRVPATSGQDFASHCSYKNESRVTIRPLVTKCRRCVRLQGPDSWRGDRTR